MIKFVLKLALAHKIIHEYTIHIEDRYPAWNSVHSSATPISQKVIWGGTIINLKCGLPWNIFRHWTRVWCLIIYFGTLHTDKYLLKEGWWLDNPQPQTLNQWIFEELTTNPYCYSYFFLQIVFRVKAMQSGIIFYSYSLFDLHSAELVENSH